MVLPAPVLDSLYGRRLPGWFPYRVRSHWDNRRVEWFLQDVWRLPPAPASQPEAASAEVFVQICRRDLFIGALACKSLLAHGATLALTVVDDGSLRPGDRELLARHLPGSRLLHGPSMMDPNSPLLAGRPNLAALALGSFPLRFKLVFPVHYARLARVIVLDADAVFWSRPAQLLDWARNGNGALYLHDVHRDARDEAPAELKRWFADEMAFLAPGCEWKLEGFYFNSGLLAFRPSDLDFGIAERALARIRSSPADLKAGPSRVWFGDWVLEQTAYMAMISFLRGPVQAFGNEYALGDPGDGVFCHFIREGLVKPGNLSFLRAFIAGACRPRL